jgi:hypothetical protein
VLHVGHESFVTARIAKAVLVCECGLARLFVGGCSVAKKKAAKKAAKKKSTKKRAKKK